MAKKEAAKKKTRFDAKRNGKPAVKTAKTAKKVGPRSQPLPGMEKVRNRKLDNLCESIGEQRELMNGAKTEERGLIQAALQEMVRAGVHTFRHACIELARVPGAEKLRVRQTKEEGDASDHDLDAGAPEPASADEGEELYEAGDTGEGD